MGHVIALWNLPTYIDGGHFCRTFQFPSALEICQNGPDFFIRTI